MDSAIFLKLKRKNASFSTDNEKEWNSIEAE